MDFGQALTALKMGSKVQREGWNGKGMYLYLVVPHSDDADPYIVMFTAQHRHQAGWLASQADMLAHDWRVA